MAYPDVYLVLVKVFTDIFNLSLPQTTVLKTTTIIPLYQFPSIFLQCVWMISALLHSPPIVMKCFEKLVISHFIVSLPSTMDPHHLDNNNTYIRMLYTDFTSAFNKVVPSNLIAKLSDLGICTSMCSWILDFITNRPQSVRLCNHISSTLILNTSVSQGCVFI